MSLQVWLPLHKSADAQNRVENKGLENVIFTNSNPSGITFTSAGIESCYTFSGYPASGIYGGISYAQGNSTEAQALCKAFMDKYINHHSFSLCGWIKTSINTGSTPIMYLTYGLGLTIGGSVIMRLSNSSGPVVCESNINVGDNKWHHICGTYDISDNKIRIYVDGQLKNTVNYTSGVTYETSWYNGLYVGRNPNDSQSTYNYHFQGSLADIRIYDHALSDKEVYELAKGLMFHLKLDNTDLYDCSGFGWNVSKYSSGTLSENTNTARYSKSLAFSNTGITMPLMIPNGTKQFSIACWVKSSGSVWRNIFSNRSGHPKGADDIRVLQGFDIYISATNTIRFYNTYSDASLTTETIPTDKFSHIVCTFREGSIKRIYINGKLSKSWDNNTGIIDYIIDGFNTSAIGLNYDNGGEVSSPMDGSISDFRIYRTALTDEQVRELYKVGGSIDNHGNAHCYELIEN